MSFHNVLLVEDERNLASALKIALKKLGITDLSEATTLREAREVLSKTQPELIILDRTLPDGDGLDLCREIRNRGSRQFILMLTARGQIQDRVDGLRGGADDYLPKPFSWEELSARVEALARRTVGQKTSGFAAGSAGSEGVGADLSIWALDEGQLRILSPSQEWVTLTPLEFKLARHLIDAGGDIVSRETLLKAVWGFTLLPKTRTVDHFMGRLRKLFEKNPEDPAHFLTVRGAGYRFQK